MFTEDNFLFKFDLKSSYHHLYIAPSMASFVAIDGPHGISMAATDGLLCCKWSHQLFPILHGVYSHKPWLS